ncbi:hypothetical protein PEPS_19900 [Persicobacter psychrovividus]|uniref:Uncharacterized protein n=1 Tax=Persicobacter psychrovividus TaxID=387638 RepID=A0ABM7VFH1_9BACT|nr:hypothetical protein PEPS_19900 [Persicobacter psychrovividus]
MLMPVFIGFHSTFLYLFNKSVKKKLHFGERTDY